MACLLAQHGQISIRKTVESAIATAFEVVSLAKIYISTCALGDLPVLPTSEMHRVLEQTKPMSYVRGPEAEDASDVAMPRFYDK